MELENPDTPDDFGPLSLSGFAEWARTNGGPLQRNEDGSFMTRRAKIRESTIKQDVAILRQFGFTMNRETSARERKELRVLDDVAEDIKFVIPYFVKDMEDRELAPATRERYLVAVRRYLRYKRSPAASIRVPGPYVPRAKRGGMISPTDLNAWIDSLPVDDDRLAIITWLILARVPIGNLAELAFGREIRVSGDEVVLVVDKAEREMPEPLERLLLKASEGGRRRGPLFLAERQPHEELGLRDRRRVGPWQLKAMTTAQLGHFWSAAREKVEPIGPTMSELGVVGRSVTLSREDGAWVYRARLDQLQHIRPSRAA